MKRNILAGLGRTALAGVIAGGTAAVGVGIWGGVNLASATGPTPSLNCTVSGQVDWTTGGDPAAIWLNSVPGGSSTLAANVTAGDPTDTQISEEKIAAVPGESLTVVDAAGNTDNETVTGIAGIATGTTGIQTYTLNITPAIPANVTVGRSHYAAKKGAAVVIAPTTGSLETTGDTPYSSDSNTQVVNLAGSGCTTTDADFGPTAMNFAGNPSTGSNSALSLESNPTSFSGNVTWTGGSNLYGSGDGENGTAPVGVSFARGGKFTGEGYSFTDGAVTNSLLATKSAGAASVSIAGVIVCTVDQIEAVGGGANPFAICDGGSSSSVSPSDAALELASVETTGSGTGSDGSPLLAIFQIDVEGSSTI